jgi:hypothetical protein
MPCICFRFVHVALQVFGLTIGFVFCGSIFLGLGGFVVTLAFDRVASRAELWPKVRGLGLVFVAALVAVLLVNYSAAASFFRSNPFALSMITTRAQVLTGRSRSFAAWPSVESSSRVIIIRNIWTRRFAAGLRCFGAWSGLAVGLGAGAGFMVIAGG